MPSTRKVFPYDPPMTQRTLGPPVSGPDAKVPREKGGIPLPPSDRVRPHLLQSRGAQTAQAAVRMFMGLVTAIDVAASHGLTREEFLREVSRTWTAEIARLKAKKETR